MIVRMIRELRVLELRLRRWRDQKLSKAQSGQATIEFTLVLILLLAFVFFFVQLALVLGWASYIQYATYLMARSLVSAGPTLQDAYDRSLTVKKQMITPGDRPRAPFLAKDDGTSENGRPQTDLSYDPNSRDYSWMEGIRYRFKSKLFLLPLGGSNKQGDGNFLHLKSEAWLGREVSDADCVGAMQDQVQNNLYDNGC